MVKSAYIHIPFCKSKCYYCSFVSYTERSLKNDYLNALENEIKHYYDGDILKTLYFGGGTPSTLEIPDFQRIVRLFNLSDSVEVTVELNPDDVDYDYMRELFDIGINRVSFGCQTFDDNILKKINRRHNSEQVLMAVGNARAAGFENLSLDFIYGLPEQTLGMFVCDLQKAAELDVPHISLYGLTLEKGSYFYESGFPDPDEDEMAAMYLAAIETLLALGYEHYEISNFAKPGYYSRHNMNYWNNEEYYGFGVAAHGYKNNVRYGNSTDLKEYIQNPIVREKEKFMTKQEQLEEEIFLGFRRMSGINVSEINSKFEIDFEEKYSYIIGKYRELDLLQKTDVGYKLTQRGILLSNVILADFIE